jgi:hypothetical protein
MRFARDPRNPGNGTARRELKVARVLSVSR